MNIDFKSSANVFEKFIKRENESINVDDVFGKECYSYWLTTRRNKPKNCEHAFRKAITGCCRGDNGLKPFSPEVEYEIIKFLKLKRVWPCFRGINGIGKRGFHSLGYWQKKSIEKSKPKLKREVSSFSQGQQNRNKLVFKGASRRVIRIDRSRIEEETINTLKEVEDLQKIINMSNSLVNMLETQQHCRLQFFNNNT